MFLGHDWHESAEAQLVCADEQLLGQVQLLLEEQTVAALPLFCEADSFYFFTSLL